MSKKLLSMEMGNLICRFGQKQVLLDLAEEIILPSFFDQNLIRSYDKTHYFFYDVRSVLLDDTNNQKIIGITGRFIKDTTLQREQIYEQEIGLIRDNETMRSSPSAIFLLILNYHRLIYVKETKDAPSKETFRSTLLSFIKEKHKSFIDSEYKKYRLLKETIANKKELDSNSNDRITNINSLTEDILIDVSKSNTNGQNLTKKKLREYFPNPTLELIPLTSTESIEEFVNKYDVLKVLEISLTQRNDENDNEPFFETLQKHSDAIGSNKSVLKHSNSKGLDKHKVIQEIAEATAQGNQSVKLRGVDSEGDSLIGNNDKFQIRKPIDELSEKPNIAAKQLYNSFNGLANEGLIKLPKTTQKVVDIINYLFKKLIP